MKVKSIKVFELLSTDGLRLRIEINSFSYEERKNLAILENKGISSGSLVYLNRETDSGVLIIELRSK